MDAHRPAQDADWLAACRRAAERIDGMLGAVPETAARVRETGTIGSGGDRTLLIDRDAEDLVIAELAALDGFRFHLVSEERGEVDYGDDTVRVVIDPIDGSLNAKRRIGHHALSVAIASGATMADVEFGYVYDFGAREEWWAVRGRGAWLDGQRLDPAASERRNRDGKLEVLGLESAEPELIEGAIGALVGKAYRLRALGAIAVSLCHVAAARFDGMVSLRKTRSVDAAAGQLIVREAGGVVSFPRCPEPLGAPLDLEPRSPVVAARSAESLAMLEAVPT
jgi:myo-inositol-1(or 4)-monophosphatase